MSTETEKVLKETAETIEKLVKAVADRDETMKANGEATTEQGTLIAKLSTKIKELEGTSLEETKKLLERLENMEKKVNNPLLHAGVKDFTSAGDQFINSDDYKNMLDANGNAKMFVSNKVLVKGLFDNVRRKQVTSDPTSAGALIVPFRDPDIITAPKRQMVVRDLLGSGNTTSPTIQYVQQTGYAPLYATLDGVHAGGTKTLTLLLDTTHTGNAGFYAGLVFNVNGEDHEIDTVSTDGVTVTLKNYGLQSEAPDGAEVVANYFTATVETKLKPRANIKFVLKEITAKTLATWLPAAKQILNDAPRLAGMINDELSFALMQVEEQQMLYGDGLGENLLGLFSDPLSQSYLWSSGTFGDTKIDAIRRSMNLTRLAEYMATGIVLHPTDWTDIQLTKGSDEHYIWINVNTGGVPQLWQLPVVDTTAVAVGQAGVGAFKLAAKVYDLQQKTIEVGTQHADYFTRNMVAILAEERIAMQNSRPEAFVNVTFDSAPVDPDAA
jgi:hypothetical protein